MDCKCEVDPTGNWILENNFSKLIKSQVPKNIWFWWIKENINKIK